MSERPLTKERKAVCQTYFRFIDLLPRFGPHGIKPPLRMVWQIHPETLCHLKLSGAFDFDGSNRIMGVEVVSSSAFIPGRLQIAITFVSE